MTAGREATVPCTCGAHPWADPEDYDHGPSCPLSAGREATPLDPELQAFLVAQINGWSKSGHPAERLARVVELAVRQQVQKAAEGA